MDPFEEMGMGARFAEQHRRSATEKEVYIFCWWMLNFMLALFYYRIGF